MGVIEPPPFVSSWGATGIRPLGSISVLVVVVGR